MPYVPVPKDLSRVKNKIAFNLTRRQLVCFALAGAVGIPFYLFSRSAIGTDAAALCMIGLMLPFFAVGMYEKDGQPLEKIIFHYVRARFLWPSVRPFKTHAIQMTRGACYAFIIILAAISIMNLINTMINSVHVRKKELGMMQAIGMSDRQLMKMLQLEGIFYTVGTLIISIGVGSLAGYPLFLYAKRTGMFDISTYHYPVTAAIIIILTLFVIQMLLAIFIAKSVRKDSLIERIRFSE